MKRILGLVGISLSSVSVAAIVKLDASGVLWFDWGIRFDQVLDE